MRILDRYIIKEIIGIFIFGILAFSTVFVGSGTLFRMAEYMTQYGAPLSAVVRIFIYSLPPIIVLTFPMSMLLSTLLTFVRLSSSSEITAMKSGGVGFFRLSLPVYVIAFFVSLFAIGFNEFVVPRTNEVYNHIVEYEIKGNTQPKSQEHIIVKELDNDKIVRLTYARKFDMETSSLYGLSVQEFENGALVRLQNAERADWDNASWTMHDGMVYDLSGEGSVQRTLRFSKQILPIKKNPKQMLQEQKKAEEMTMRELKEQVKVLALQGADVKKLESEFYQRLTIPFASFVFALIGAPLGMQPNRSSSSVGFGISMFVIFVYYAAMTLFGAFGQSGALPSALGAWAPNILCGLIGIWLIRRASK